MHERCVKHVLVQQIKLFLLRDSERYVLGLQVSVDHLAYSVQIVQAIQKLPSDLTDERQWDASPVVAVYQIQEIFT